MSDTVYPDGTYSQDPRKSPQTDALERIKDYTHRARAAAEEGNINAEAVYYAWADWEMRKLEKNAHGQHVNHPMS